MSKTEPRLCGCGARHDVHTDDDDDYAEVRFTGKVGDVVIDGGDWAIVKSVVQSLLTAGPALLTTETREALESMKIRTIEEY